MAECRSCDRIIKRGHFCSDVVCQARAEKQAQVDAKALAHNTRYWAAKAQREAMAEQATGNVR